MAPKVSICLPNPNNRRFLPERLESIFQQSFTHWGLVVVDNYSDDGAWGYFVEEAAKERRMRISQAPREGVYANWNNCIRQAQSNEEKLRVLFQQLLRRPRPVIDHIVDRLWKRNWGFINCDNRYGHLRRLLNKYGVPSPVFE